MSIRVSEISKGAGRACTALGYVLALAALLWCAGYQLSHGTHVFHLFHYSFGGFNGHRLLSTLAEARNINTPYMLFVGGSQIREGVDETVIETKLPEMRVLNGGTSRGSVHVYAAIAEMLRQSKVRPNVLVIGLSPRLMITRQVGFAADGYTELLDLWNGRDVVFHESRFLAEPVEQDILANSVWPYRRVAQQLGRLIRVGLYEAQVRLTWRETALPRAAFEFKPGELTKMKRYAYDGDGVFSTEQFESVRQYYEREGLFNPLLYGWDQHYQLVTQTLEFAMRNADRVVILLMPDPPLARKHFYAGSARFYEFIKGYEARGVRLLDYSALYGDDMFRDLGHLTESGRRRFSQRLVDDLKMIEVTPQKSDNGANADEIDRK